MSSNQISVTAKMPLETTPYQDLIEQLEKFINGLDKVNDLRDIADNIEAIITYKQYLGYRFYITCSKDLITVHKKMNDGRYGGTFAEIEQQ